MFINVTGLIVLEVARLKGPLIFKKTHGALSPNTVAIHLNTTYMISYTHDELVRQPSEICDLETFPVKRCAGSSFLENWMEVPDSFCNVPNGQEKGCEGFCNVPNGQEKASGGFWSLFLGCFLEISRPS